MADDDAGFGYDPTGEPDCPFPPPRYVDTLPPSYVVTGKYLPPVGQQGTTGSPGYPGSCTAWASTYGLATFAAARAGLVNPKQPIGQASPAFIYIKVLQEKGLTTCGVTNFAPYFSLLESDGTPNMDKAPYTTDCQTLWSAYENDNPPLDPAFKVKARCIKDINLDLDPVKQILASNRALAYGTKLYTDWNSYHGDLVPYVGNGHILHGKNGPAGHSMLIIGYDDSLGTGGAFMIQNSQGTDWGEYGYVWMAYETFQKLAHGLAFYVP
jgi:hypothetical protein